MLHLMPLHTAIGCSAGALLRLEARKDTRIFCRHTFQAYSTKPCRPKYFFLQLPLSGDGVTTTFTGWDSLLGRSAMQEPHEPGSDAFGDRLVIIWKGGIDRLP